MSKTIGSALYLELRRGTGTAQVLVTPTLAHPVRGTTIPVNVLTRQISSTNPRRGWKFYTTDFSDFPTGLTPNEATAHTGKYINDITAYFLGLASGGWTLYESPLSVEMSLDDLEEIITTETPNALLRRMMRVRAEAGFMDELFASE
ncbi:MAG: hypothetical protein ACRC5T_04290 [Cetobacterium sp.]